MIDDGVK